MRLDELLKAMLRSFFIIVTGITISMYIFCVIFSPNAVFTVNEIGRILFTAIATDLPFIIFYSKKELGKKQMLVRFLIHMPVILAILLYLAYEWEWIDMGNIKEIIVFIALILGVYAAVVVVNTFREKKIADQLNDRLKKRYNF